MATADKKNRGAEVQAAIRRVRDEFANSPASTGKVTIAQAEFTRVHKRFDAMNNPASTSRRVALVTGATGVVGRNLIAHLLEHGGWEIIAISRRKPDLGGDFTHLALDLLDRSACEHELGRLDRVTHVFHTAYIQRASPTEMVAPNLAMFANTVETLEPVARNLAHVLFMQGTKYYGSHLGPFKTPALEDDPRHAPPNFYYDLQDYIVRRSQGKRWTWSAPRPHAVIGFALGNPMNLSTVIAVYATLCKALGQPFAFPGTEGSYRALYQCTDAALLARAMTWMATEPRCANQAYNVVNGDLIRWQHLWPVFARFFDFEPAPPASISLARTLADKGPLWDRIVAQHGLQPHRYQDIVSWAYGDIVFSTEHDIVSGMGKAWRSGFHEVMDTEAMFLDVFARYRRARIIP
jgi:nucleoside-diphosphate-sugar epimerase